MKYKAYPNVIVFDFAELNESVENTLVKIVDNIYGKLSKLLDGVMGSGSECVASPNLGLNPGFDLNKPKCIERIKLMNQRYEEIKHKPFSYIDNFFEIHGSHRNRKQ